MDTLFLEELRELRDGTMARSKTVVSVCLFVYFGEMTTESSAGFKLASAVGHLQHSRDEKTPQPSSGDSPPRVYRRLIFMLLWR